MATFGVEGIRYFSHLRASGEVADAPDLTTCSTFATVSTRAAQRGAYTPILLGEPRRLGKRPP